MHPINTTDLGYKSYVLRLWRDAAGRSWRATLQSVHTEEILHFSNVDALFMFLEAQVRVEEAAEHEVKHQTRRQS